MPRSARKSRVTAADRDLADRLHSAAIHLLRRLRRVDEAAGLSAPRLSALSVLVFGGPCSLKDLAAAEQVRPPSMTRLVQELENAGLLRREADPADGRAVRLHATAKAVRLLKEGRSRRVEMLAADLTRIAAIDRRALASAINALEQLARRSPES